MPATVTSLYKTSIALAGAGIIAVSPLTPSQSTPITSVHLPQIQLTDLSIPAFGAIPYQIGINLLGDILAATPILIGSTQQCDTYCLGPNTPAPLPTYAPFTGWGLVGLGKGLISSPAAFIGALQAGRDVPQALGVALLALQVPITNTFSLLTASRMPFGGFGLQATLERTFTASQDALVAGYQIAAQALVQGPLTVLGGAVAGATAFASTLAQTGDIVTALTAGRAPIQQAVTAAANDLAFKIDTGRARVYADLLAGPGATTRPIPTVPAPSGAASRLTKSTNTKTTAAGGATSTAKKGGVAGSKRAHKAASAR
ncbi:hypothetical protein [Mycolicibacterium aichiense]|uniref:Uncharacterized protein n=1 Tax=Mycolicibacterium aichiense TaxID=1799 RepID=A0AAD1HPT8_9MYCO|nr:hypothetical protein [Mycolicibacterium aichiense]MCV7016802.1 hypothetical protein [Mycolicibacterium aichiense]BBX09412.1 hypothetical protein MAIC_42150 [Mycolicibacterium aichiense]SUA13978.1 Uncharacterised protein [Mycolicibacterium aichiense]